MCACGDSMCKLSMEGPGLMTRPTSARDLILLEAKRIDEAGGGHLFNPSELGAGRHLEWNSEPERCAKRKKSEEVSGTSRASKSGKPSRDGHVNAHRAALHCQPSNFARRDHVTF